MGFLVLDSVRLPILDNGRRKLLDRLMYVAYMGIRSQIRMYTNCKKIRLGESFTTSEGVHISGWKFKDLSTNKLLA